MRELMELPEETIKKLNEDLNDFNNFPERDGVVLPTDLYGAYRDGKSSGIDMLIGTNKDEVRYWIREMGYYFPGIKGMILYRHGLPIVYENNEKRMSPGERKQARSFLQSLSGPKVWRLTEFYNEVLFRLPAMQQALLHSQSGSRAYTYYWTCAGSDPRIGACHAMELSYVFRNLDETIYTGTRIDRELADTVQEMWANFARNGDPSVNRYKWETYNADTRKTMVLGNSTHMEEDLKGEQRRQLEGLLHHYFNGCYTQLSFRVPYVRKAVAGLLSAAALGLLIGLVKKNIIYDPFCLTKDIVKNIVLEKVLFLSGKVKIMEFIMIETGWLSILPPLIAIVLALITKEVYSSLFIGIMSGMLIYAFAGNGTIVSAAAMTFDMMSSKIADNAYMIIFLALLWAVVSLVSRSGGSQAYGRWAGKRLNSKRSANFATSLLGVLIFIDDGFNCLTVGTVMRPITDRLRISREKLAYIIDATAAPVCIIAPVSSWAVAVASEVSEKNGFHIFLSTIPYNFYALMTILMVFVISFTGRDFGPMKKAEEEARSRAVEEQIRSDASAPKGRVIDLVLPIVVLIVCAILGMAYVGGFFEGVSFSEAIGYNPTAGLSLGAFAGLITAMLLFLPRKLMTPKEFIECIVSGIGNIVPPMLILILSWSLGGVCRQLIGTGVFISGFVNNTNLPLGFLPFLIFIIAALMSFSMGTSWGTFGMLIPIVTMICETDGAAALLIPVLGATLAGSVYGDHCSPISDTTILASTGADCVHIRHVETQLPYATLVAGVCAVGYLIVGFVNIPIAAIAVEAVLLVGSILFLSQKPVK